MKSNRKINKVDNVKNTKKVIIFPLEIKSRDLIPRLEIASKFVEKNYHVIIGEQTAIHKNINHLPVGILFENAYWAMRRLCSELKISSLFTNFFCG